MCSMTSKLHLSHHCGHAPLIARLCLTLDTFTGPDPDPDLWPDFLAWPQTCLIITNLPDSLDYWLNLATIPGLVFLASLGGGGMGPG